MVLLSTLEGEDKTLMIQKVLAKAIEAFGISNTNQLCSELQCNRLDAVINGKSVWAFFKAYSSWKGVFMYLSDLLVAETADVSSYTELVKCVIAAAGLFDVSRVAFELETADGVGNSEALQLALIDADFEDKSLSEGWLIYRLHGDQLIKMATESEGDLASPIPIRDACGNDARSILGMIQELADFENMPTGPEITEGILKRNITNENVHVMLPMNPQHEPIGYCLYYKAFSVKAGRICFMEDLYVKPEHRNCGVGKTLWRRLAAVCRRDFDEMRWNVLDWNAGAIAFYEKHGAVKVPHLRLMHRVMK